MNSRLTALQCFASWLLHSHKHVLFEINQIDNMKVILHLTSA